MSELKNNTDNRIAAVAADYHKSSPYTKKLIWANISRGWPVQDLDKFEQATELLRQAELAFQKGEKQWDR